MKPNPAYTSFKKNLTAYFSLKYIKISFLIAILLSAFIYLFHFAQWAVGERALAVGDARVEMVEFWGGDFGAGFGRDFGAGFGAASGANSNLVGDAGEASSLRAGVSKRGNPQTNDNAAANNGADFAAANGEKTNGKISSNSNLTAGADNTGTGANLNNANENLNKNAGEVSSLRASVNKRGNPQTNDNAAANNGADFAAAKSSNSNLTQPAAQNLATTTHATIKPATTTHAADFAAAQPAIQPAAQPAIQPAAQPTAQNQSPAPLIRIAALVGLAAALCGLWLLLAAPRGVWFFTGCFVGAMWFWWISLSLRFFGVGWAIPLEIALIAATYGVLFGVAGLWRGAIVRAAALVALGYIHPLNFNWLNFELIFVNTPFFPAPETLFCALLGLIALQKIPALSAKNGVKNGGKVGVKIPAANQPNSNLVGNFAQNPTQISPISPTSPAPTPPATASNPVPTPPARGKFAVQILAAVPLALALIINLNAFRAQNLANNPAKFEFAAAAQNPAAAHKTHENPATTNHAPTPTTNHAPAPTPATPLKIALIHTAVAQDVKWQPAHQTELIAQVFALIDDALARGAGLIVLPETAFAFALNRQSALMDALAERSQRAGILVGALGRDGGRLYNSVFFFHAGAVRRFDKRVLVPFGEYNPLPRVLARVVNEALFGADGEFSAGAQWGDFALAGGRFRAAICFEATRRETFVDGFAAGAGGDVSGDLVAGESGADIGGGSGGVAGINSNLARNGADFSGANPNNTHKNIAQTPSLRAVADGLASSQACCQPRGNPQPARPANANGAKLQANGADFVGANSNLARNGGDFNKSEPPAQNAVTQNAANLTATAQTPRPAQPAPKFIVVSSNLAWFRPSSAASLQQLMIRRGELLHAAKVYHALNY